MSKKFFYFALLIRCGIKAFLRGSARSVSKDPKAIVVFQLAQLGDMVCTTPVFRAIKARYPGVRLYVVGQPILEELLRYNSDVDEYIPYVDFNDVKRKLISASIDYALSPAPSFIALALGYLSGIEAIAVPKIIHGFSPNMTFSYRLLSRLVITKPHRMGSYAPREYLRLLEPIGIMSEDIKKHLGYSLEAGEKIEQFFLERGIISGDLVVGISPSSGNKIKNWNADRFAKVADYIFKEYQAKVIIIGGPKDDVEVGDMMRYLAPETPVINTLKLFGIDELKALIARMNVLIAVDTGPIYIAEALGVKTIDIIGPMDEREQPPTGPRHVVVKWDDRKEPAIHIMNARTYDVSEARRQVEMISSEAVCAAFDSLMNTKQ